MNAPCRKNRSISHNSHDARTLSRDLISDNREVSKQSNHHQEKTNSRRGKPQNTGDKRHKDNNIGSTNRDNMSEPRGIHILFRLTRKSSTLPNKESLEQKGAFSREYTLDRFEKCLANGRDKGRERSAPMTNNHEHIRSDLSINA